MGQKQRLKCCKPTMENVNHNCTTLGTLVPQWISEVFLLGDESIAVISNFQFHGNIHFGCFEYKKLFCADVNKIFRQLNNVRWAFIKDFYWTTSIYHTGRWNCKNWLNQSWFYRSFFQSNPRLRGLLGRWVGILFSKVPFQ